MPLTPPPEVPAGRLRRNARRGPGRWVPCEDVERPWDPEVILHGVPCRGCALFVRATMAQVTPRSHPNLWERLVEALKLTDPEGALGRP